MPAVQARRRVRTEALTGMANPQEADALATSPPQAQTATQPTSFRRRVQVDILPVRFCSVWRD
jgi:hypothetical protein